MTLSRAAKRFRISRASVAVRPRLRDTKTVRPSRATVPTIGQPATSAFETKHASSTPPRARMSSQEEGFGR